MPDCRYCEATFETDEGLADHLASDHEWETLSRIDRKRVEVFLPERVPDGTTGSHPDTSELDDLLDQTPTTAVCEQALAEHERLIRQAEQEGARSRARDLFWDYFEPLTAHLDDVVEAEGWPVLAELLDVYDPDSESPATRVIGNVTGRYVVRTRLADGVTAIPETALASLLALRGDEGGAGWEEAAAYGWGIGHPDVPVADRIHAVAREDIYWVTNALEHAFYADQHAACDCLAEVVTDDEVTDIRFPFNAVSRCDRVDTWPTVPRFWDWSETVDLSFRWDPEVVARIRELVVTTGRADDLPENWSFQDLVV